MSNEIDSNLHCAFCGKNAKDVKKLIAGPTVCICDECVDLCHGILDDISSPSNKKDTDLVLSVTDDADNDDTPTPRIIKKHLDQYVIGQEDAKRTIAVAVYNHFMRLDNPIIDGVEIEKSNILMIGPTGSGKTLIVQSIANLLDVPLAIADATTLTSAGYVGDDVESIISKLYMASGNNISKTERGIVFLDEIDKVRATSSGGNATKDVGGEAVQQGLLKLLEGSDILIPPQGKRSPGGEMIRVSTKNILFIVGGSFVGLEKIIEKAQTIKEGANSIGFNSKPVTKKKQTTSELLQAMVPEHLVKYGMIPELVGRLPVYATLTELSEENLIQVLTEPKNAIVKQFIARFGLDDVELEFSLEALHEIAKAASARKTGARGLRSVIENSLMKIQFELPELSDKGVYKVIINPGVVMGSCAPEYIYSGEVIENMKIIEDKRLKSQ